MKVLVAEDDPVSRYVVETTLSKWGFQVLACEDGDQAWARLQGEDPPELAVLDWMMPGVDGLELCRRIRGSPELRSTYVIMLTTRDRREDLVRGLQAGADDYISKPFDPEELRARVRVGQRLVELQTERLEEETAHYVRQLEQAVSQLQESRRRIVVEQEETKKAIAEEIHGPVQTQLFMLYLRLGQIAEKIDATPQEARTELIQAADQLDGIRENEIRQISHRLHPSIIGLGIVPGLKTLRD